MEDCLEDDWSEDNNIMNAVQKVNREKPLRGRQRAHSLRTLGIVIALVGTLSFIPSPTISGSRGPKQQLMGLLVSETAPGIELDLEQIRPAQYSNATSTSARLFRNKDEQGYPTSIIGGKQTHGRPHQSMYELLWQGYKLPNWARKVPHFRGFQPPEGHSVCLIHVGKTAGSSIGCALGFNLHCGDGKQYLPGRLPKSATNAFHKDVYDCPSSTDFYLFVVRDPLARARSAFVYGRPDKNGHSNEGGKLWNKIKQIYIDCGFSTVNELAASGLSIDGTSSDKCKQLASDMLRGKTLYEAHMFYNYQYYLESIPHKSNILVIRTEHMEEDWNKIEKGLGGTPRSNLKFPRDNSAPKEARDSILGEEERMLLCHELCVEIQTYKLLLRNALNINGTQYDTSMEELLTSCPKEAVENQCDFHTPNIKTKLLENRGFPKP